MRDLLIIYYDKNQRHCILSTVTYHHRYLVINISVCKSVYYKIIMLLVTVFGVVLQSGFVFNVLP